MTTDKKAPTPKLVLAKALACKLHKDPSAYQDIPMCEAAKVKELLNGHSTLKAWLGLAQYEARIHCTRSDKTAPGGWQIRHRVAFNCLLEEKNGLCYGWVRSVESLQSMAEAMAQNGYLPGWDHVAASLFKAQLEALRDLLNYEMGDMDCGRADAWILDLATLWGIELEL